MEHYTLICQLAPDSSLDKCKNTAIQQGRTKRVELRKSEYGFGLFLALGETAKEQDFIMGQQSSSSYVRLNPKHRSFGSWSRVCRGAHL